MAKKRRYLNRFPKILAIILSILIIITISTAIVLWFSKKTCEVRKSLPFNEKYIIDFAMYKNNTVQFNPFFKVPVMGNSWEFQELSSKKGNYVFEMVTDDSCILHQYNLGENPFHTSIECEGLSCGSSFEMNPALFLFNVPAYNAKIFRVRLNNTIIGQVKRSRHVPTLELLSNLKKMDIKDGEVVEIKWKGKDKDKDKLVYSFYIEGGSSVVIEIDYTKDYYVLNTSHLQTGKHNLILRVSDGINTNEIHEEFEILTQR
jgi:hypothetical protein